MVSGNNATKQANPMDNAYLFAQKKSSSVAPCTVKKVFPRYKACCIFFTTRNNVSQRIFSFKKSRNPEKGGKPKTQNHYACRIKHKVFFIFGLIKKIQGIKEK